MTSTLAGLAEGSGHFMRQTETAPAIRATSQSPDRLHHLLRPLMHGLRSTQHWRIGRHRDPPLSVVLRPVHKRLESRPSPCTSSHVGGHTVHNAAHAAACNVHGSRDGAKKSSDGIGESRVVCTGSGSENGGVKTPPTDTSMGPAAPSRDVGEARWPPDVTLSRAATYVSNGFHTELFFLGVRHLQRTQCCDLFEFHEAFDAAKAPH